MIRSLFFDIDGTLCSFKTHEIPSSTIKALEAAKARGVQVFIATGRPISIITNLRAIEHLIDGYITTNGAYCFVGKDVVRCTPIPDEDVRLMLCDALEYGYPCLVAGDRGMAVYNEPKEMVDRIFRRELNVRNIDMDKPANDILAGHVLQLTSFFPADYEPVLMKQVKHCISARWHPEFTDITSIEADKGKGLASMAAHLGLDISETMAFGDGGNDISIIRKAGIGVAMGNAGDNVKAIADYVTTHIDDDGVTNALRHFGVIDDL